jgi:hypothetical protein
MKGGNLTFPRACILILSVVYLFQMGYEPFSVTGATTGGPERVECIFLPGFPGHH